MISSGGVEVSWRWICSTSMYEVPNLANEPSTALKIAVRDRPGDNISTHIPTTRKNKVEEAPTSLTTPRSLPHISLSTLDSY